MAIPSTVVSAANTVDPISDEYLVFPPAPVGAIKDKHRRLRREASLQQPLGGHEELTNPEGRTSAHDWEEAVNAVAEVTCPFCFCALPAQDAVDDKMWRYIYVKHMTTAHELGFTDARRDSFAEHRAHTVRPLFSSCPLCGATNLSAMENHITGHLRLLALKSLPTYEDGRTRGPESNAHTESSVLGDRSTIREFMKSVQDLDKHSDEWKKDPHTSTDEGEDFGGGTATTLSAIRLAFPDSPALSQMVQDFVRELPPDQHYADGPEPACAICQLPAVERCEYLRLGPRPWIRRVSGGQGWYCDQGHGDQGGGLIAH